LIFFENHSLKALSSFCFFVFCFGEQNKKVGGQKRETKTAISTISTQKNQTEINKNFTILKLERRVTLKVN